MEKVKQILKNDQTNHLADQVLEFEKTMPRTKKSSANSSQSVGNKKATADIDVVTTSYIRGYN
ncbi:MAG: hypothetical protein HRU23_03115 [Gammaproteobacteria bacterium]|nr:hypothetical protein [Gammaproteobacteria bacterium]